ncbi:MAG: DMT family transporter [Crocinitomicaceae bacterium]|nr:DMT family transporter [Crocinitomicaceae bacterium]
MNKGIAYIILAGICFTVVNFFVKLLGPNGSTPLFENLQTYPAHELVLARSIISFIISYAIIRKRKLTVLGNNRLWLIIRGLAGTIALTIFFYSMHHLPLAIAAIVQYLAPIFTIFFAIILLKEKVRKIQWIFITMSFIGVLFIGLDKLLLNSNNLSFLWLGLGIVSAVFSGLAYTAILKLKSTDNALTIVMYFPMIAIPVMTLFCLFEFTMPKGIEWIILLIIGVFTQFAQILMTKALHNGSASTITPFQYIGAVYAFLIGYFIFDEITSWIIDIGMILVVLGVLLNALSRRSKS